MVMDVECLNSEQLSYSQLCNSFIYIVLFTADRRLVISVFKSVCNVWERRLTLSNWSQG